jgi:putative PIN family toxin of toxin-antitoxin system
MIRAVLDANVIVSAVLTKRGVSWQILEALRSEQFVLVISETILFEWGRVLRYAKVRKLHGLKEKQIAGFLDDLSHLAIPTAGEFRLPTTTRDASDDRYLECAIEGNAAFLVSGDQDLLVLEQFEGIEIVSPRAFVSVLDKAAGGR